VTVRFDSKQLEAQIKTALLREGGTVRQEVQRRARRVKDAARANARRMMEEPTGRLAGSIRYTTAVRRGDLVTAQVGSDLHYARWVHDGTGVYGPHRSPIVPRTSRFMKFNSRLGFVVFTERSVGQPGKPYLAEALSAAF
jgi:hypothetical protein